MAKSTGGARRRHRQAGVRRLVAVGGGGGFWRLAMIESHRDHGACVALTARHLGFSRPTVYRWLGRYEPHGLRDLEDRP